MLLEARLLVGVHLGSSSPSLPFFDNDESPATMSRADQKPSDYEDCTVIVLAWGPDDHLTVPLGGSRGRLDDTVRGIFFSSGTDFFIFSLVIFNETGVV